MAERVVEGFGRLPGQGAAALVGDRAGDHDREARPRRVELLGDREEGRLGVQGVEDGFDHEEVDPAFDQGTGLFGVRGAKLLEGDLSRSRIVHVGRDRRGAVHRPQDTGNVAGPVGACRAFVGGPARDPRRREVDLADGVLDAVVRHREPRGAERVRLDDVRAGIEVGAVDLADHVGAREAQQVVVAEEGDGVGGEVVAAEVGLGERVALDHGAHRAVEDQDTLLEEALERGTGRLGDGGRRAVRLRAIRRRAPHGRTFQIEPRRTHRCPVLPANAPGRNLRAGVAF